MWSRDERHGAALKVISESLRPMNELDIYWTISHPRYEAMRGASEFNLDTLYKLIAIIHKLSSTKDRTGNHGDDRFLANICAGTFRTTNQRKAVVDSMYHFLYLVDDHKRVSVGMLFQMLSGLPFNKKRFVNCALPVRNKQVEAMLLFIIKSLTWNRSIGDSYPRGITVGYDRTITINSEKIIDLLMRRTDEADRIITMFVEEQTDIGVLEERLETHAALDMGVL